MAREIECECVESYEKLIKKTEHLQQCRVATLLVLLRASRYLRYIRYLTTETDTKSLDLR